MRILSRYVLREHVAPFLFALVALTLLLLLDQVSKRFGDLVGKGLEWHVIAEVFVLSVPFIVAMTLPMAVLIAVLYTFNRLAGDNEITAMKAGGVNLPRVLTPLLGAGVVVAGALVWWNNTVLPESNHHLQNLMAEINRKKPTFALQERTVNEVLPHQLYMETGRIDRSRSFLRDVAVFDQRDARYVRTIYADSAHMAYSPDRTDLYLTLFDGVTFETKRDDPASFRRHFFRQQILHVPEVTNRLERGSNRGYRGDREMSIGQMQAEVDSAVAQAVRVQNTGRALGVAVTRALLGGSPSTEPEDYVALAAPVVTARDGNPRGAAGKSQGREKTTGKNVEEGADSAARTVAADEAAGADGGTDTLALDSAAGARAGDASLSPVQMAADRFLLSELRTALRDARQIRTPQMVASRFGIFENRLTASLQRKSRFAVEIQKKIAIPVACVVFILIGAPIAIRYPLGGVGMVVGVSFAFFCAYYVSLVGGEELADRLILSPFWAMWAPNVLFGLLGAGLVWRSVKVG